MHVFADNLSCAYRTVVYVCFIQGHNVQCIFIASKLRLEPLSQRPSVLQLELQAAVIANRLGNAIPNEIPVKKENTLL